MAKILVIDDDTLIVSYLERILQGAGHKVVTVARGIDAVSQFEVQRPDLVVIDVWMPGQDGFETMRSIRNFDPHSKVIACSGHPSYYGRRVAEVAAERGANAFMAKPFTAQEFLDLVARVLSESQAAPGPAGGEAPASGPA
jgi:DNA-binding NtrC family response regulator